MKMEIKHIESAEEDKQTQQNYYEAEYGFISFLSVRPLMTKTAVIIEA
jgi:hypothetical protein